jgi:hypothetical protein
MCFLLMLKPFFSDANVALNKKVCSCSFSASIDKEGARILLNSPKSIRRHALACVQVITALLCTCGLVAGRPSHHTGDKMAWLKNACVLDVLKYTILVSSFHNAASC